MSLGVLNNISAIYAQNNLSSTQANLQKTLQQLSSGSRINSGADDAAGLSIANGLQANEAALTQSSANATDGVGLLQVADGALSQVTNLLNRAITLATEAGNGTLDSSQLAAAQQEYGDILSEINTIGSSTVFNGNAVFSNAVTNIFTSDGTTIGTSSYSVGSGTLNTATGVGVTAPNGGASTLSLPPLQTANDSTGTTYAAAVASVDTLAGGAAATDNVVGSIQLYVGTNSFTISTGSAGESLTALAGQITSVTGATTDTTTTPGDIIITAAKAGVANGITLGVSSLYDTTGSAALTKAVTTAAADAVAYSPASIEAYAITGDSAADTFTNNNLSFTIGGVTSSVNFTGTGGVDTKTQLIADINTAFGYTAAAAGAGGKITITASATGTANDFTANGSVTDLLAAPGSVSGAATPGIALAGTDLNTNGDAAIALTDVYKAIGDVAYQRGAVGANINTLTAVSNVETTQNVNIASAQNSITATDYGAATSNLSKYEILSQTGISALAQANSVQQEVLKLLQ